MGERQYHFLQGGGETGEIIRNIDWASTELGAPEQWPVEFKVAVRLMLDSPFALYVCLGKELRMLYNDPFIPTMGTTRHPGAIGKPIRLVSQKWSVMQPIITKVMEGQAAVMKDRLFTINKNGYEEECFFDITYIPIRSPAGIPSGVQATVFEKTDKVVAMNKLIASEQLFRDLADQAPMMVFMADADARVTFWNRFWLQYTGQRAEDALDRAWDEFVHPADFPRLLQEYIGASQSRRRYSVEARILNKEGQYRYFLFTGGPRFNADGSFAGNIGNGVEIHDRKQVESDLIRTTKNLELSEAKFRKLIEEAPVATSLFTGPELKIEVANDIMIRLWGRGGSVIGKPLKEALPELSNQQFPRLLREVYDTGISHHGNSTPADLLINGKLKTIYFDFTYKAVRNPSGEIYGVMQMAIDVSDRVTAQQELEKSQQQLLAYFRESPVAVAIIDKEQLTFRMANPFYGELVGRLPDEIVDKPLLEALPELKGQGFDKLLKEVISTGLPFTAREVPVEILRAGKLEKIFVNLTYQPRSGADNKVSGVLVVATDVTQQVIARQYVEESEVKFRALIEEAPIATCLFRGPDLEIEVANDIMLGFWGATKAAIGKPLGIAVPELQGQPFLHLLQEVYRTGKTYEDTSAPAVLKKNGILGTYYFDFTYKALRNPLGEIYGVMEMAVDVTPRVLAKQALEESKNQLQFAIDATELGTWDLNPGTNKFTGNDRLKGWFGLAPDDEIELSSAIRVIAESDRDRVIRDIEHALTFDSGGDYDTEYAIVNPVTKKEIIVKAKGKTSFDANGAAIRFNGTLQDITRETIAKELEKAKIEKLVYERTKELAEANRSLQSLNDKLAQFAYIASHDLQEPVRKISTFTQMLESSLEKNDGKSSIYFAKIIASTNRMSDLIRDVLAYSQLSEDPHNLERVDLQQILTGVRNDFELVIERKEASLEYTSLPAIPAIPMQMSQLFSNLLSNSLKYTRTDTKPVIRVDSRFLLTDEILQNANLNPQQRYCLIRFEDNGIGFSSEHGQRIFRIFQRLHGSGEYAGTGIGLAICKRIVENHHGTIDAAGSEAGRAIFNIILPA